uniref:Uncharacterized protein n=1 Tax=Panagrolaimus sp. ES5 TaxID=591445 RepID=A0AC34F349_9BILA
MTSRRYSETDIAQMSTVNEEDEQNISPIKDLNETPRAKYVPSKRIFENNSSILGNSRTSILEAEMQAYSETNCKCEKFASAMIEYESLSFNNNASFLGSSQISFLEEEMQIYANETCKCERFKAIIKEYNYLIENFKLVAPQKFASSQDETVKLKEEFEKAKLEMEEYKSSAESSKKENQRLQIELEEEKERAKDRNGNLQKKFEEMKLEDGKEKQVDDKLKEQIAQLNDDLLKAQSENDRYKILAEKAQNVIDSLQITLKNEKQSFNAKNDEFEKRQNSENEALKLNMEDSMIENIEKLKESEKLTQQLQTDIILIQNDKQYFQNLFSLNERENADIKKASINKLHNQIANHNAELIKAKEENGILIKSAENAQIKIKNLEEALKISQGNVQSLNAVSAKQNQDENKEALKIAMNKLKILNEKLIESEKQQLESAKMFSKLEAENKILSNENAKFEKHCSSKDDEIMKLKESVANEKRERQAQVFQLSDQLAKATDRLEEFKNATMGDSSTKEAEIISLKQKLEAIEQMKAELKKNCDEFKAKIQVLQTKSEEMERQHNFKSDENVALKEAAEKEKIKFNEQILHLDNELCNFKKALSQANLKEKEIVALKEKLQNCEQKEVEMKQMYDKVMSEMEVIGNEKVDLQYACASKDVEISKIMDQKHQLEKEHSSVLDNLREANEELEKLQATINHGKQKYSQLKELLKQKDEEIEALNAVEKEADTQNQEINSLQKKVNHYKKKNAESEEICNYLRADIDVLKTKNANLERLCDTKEGEIIEMKNTVEKEKAKLQNQISQLNDQYLKAISDVEGYKAVAENVEKEIRILRATLENERNLANAKIAEIQQHKNDEIEAFKATFGDTTTLKEEITALNNKIQSFEQKLSDAEKIIAKANNDIAFLKSEKAYLEKNLSMKKAEIAELQQRNDTENSGIANKEVEALQAENQELKEKLATIYQDIAEAEVARKESDDLLFELKSKLDTIDTSNTLIRPNFDIPEDLSQFLASDFSFKSPTAAAAEQPQPPFTANISNIHREIRRENDAMRNSRVSKNMNRKKAESSKKDYNSEDSCNTQ